MAQNWNWKRTNYEDYDYSSQERKNKYSKYSYIPKATKINNYLNQKPQKFKNYQKNTNENQYSSHYVEINDFQPFYPKNLKKSQKQFSDDNNHDEQYSFSQIENNDFSNYENSINNNNYENNKNENQFQNNNYLDEEISTCPSENLQKQEIEEQYKKPKKYGIKNIPHPKRRKNHGSCYISSKKYIPFKHKKEEEIFIKKERKLSISSGQNNFDSAKHSISTLNTSSSSYKEKDVFNEDKLNNSHIDNKNEEINNKESNLNDTKIIKNKFDENMNQIKKYEPQIDPYNENTEILKVNVKLPNNQIVIFKLRRFDDLFLTIKLFCEINSIDEKFIKPLIIKSLCTINTIYQLYNSNISSENIDILKKVKSISDNINDMEISNR